MAGVSRSAVGNWVTRNASFPKPLADLACGQIWDKRTIELWLRVNGHIGDEKMDLNATLNVGQTYTHDFICKMYGGDAKSGTYLPQSKQTILCGCFTTIMNPEAPQCILVGNVPKVITKAERLATQGGSIPVFMKRAVNQWEFAGVFEFVKFSRDPKDFEEKAIAADRSDVVGALFFRCAT